MASSGWLTTHSASRRLQQQQQANANSEGSLYNSQQPHHQHYQHPGGTASGAGGGRKRSGPDAFHGDWGTYENERGGATTQKSRAVPGDGRPQHAPSYPSRGGGGGGGASTRVLSPYNSGGRSSTSVGKMSLSPNSADARLPPALVQSCIDMNNASGGAGRGLKPTVVVPDDGSLNEEQRLVVGSILSGYSTFFTGPAGSGKSHVLSSVLRLNEEGNLARKKRIVVTATTGIAACNVGGVTIHSFSGAGTGDGRLEDMAARVMGNNYAKKRWRDVDILVIDEISMMPAGFFDKLDFIASRARGDRRKFGGLQLVICGDFFQLPPVNLSTGFAFEAKCWPKVIQTSVLLKQVFRQNGDTRLMDILNEARVGELSEGSVQTLRTHSLMKQAQAPSGESSDVRPTLLECRNQQVDQANAREMSKLSGEAHVFNSKDRAVSKGHEAQLRHCAAPDKLLLKMGAQVILLKNLDPDNGLVNGTRGVVVDFQKPNKTKAKDMPREFRSLELPVVQFEAILPPGTSSSKDGEVCEVQDDDDKLLQMIEPAEWTNKVGDCTVSARQQLPLRLAWALSVHKSQGMTIPHLSVSLKGVFEYGQAYVALSRATKLSLLTLHGFDERCIRAHPKVKAFYRLLTGETSSFKSPQPRSSTANANSSGSASNPSPPITAEQQKKIEQNRQRALRIRKEKAALQAAASGLK